MLSERQLKMWESLIKASTDPLERKWSGDWDFHPIDSGPNPRFVGSGCGPQVYGPRESEKEAWRKFMDQIQADAAFIAAARDGMPKLIAELRQLRKSAKESSLPSETSGVSS